MKHVKLGLIGLGQWPRQAYVPVLKGLEGVDVVAVAAKSPATQQYAREQFGDVVVYSDYSDLCEDPRVEAVALAVPNPIHEAALTAAVFLRQARVLRTAHRPLSRGNQADPRRDVRFRSADRTRPRAPLAPSGSYAR